MSLKAVVDNLDGVDEKYHDLYEEKDGKFVLLPIEGMKSQKEFDFSFGQNVLAFVYRRNSDLPPSQMQITLRCSQEIL